MSQGIYLKPLWSISTLFCIVWLKIGFLHNIGIQLQNQPHCINVGPLHQCWDWIHLNFESFSSADAAVFISYNRPLVRQSTAQKVDTVNQIVALAEKNDKSVHPSRHIHSFVLPPSWAKTDENYHTNLHNSLIALTDDYPQVVSVTDPQGPSPPH